MKKTGLFFISLGLASMCFGQSKIVLLDSYFNNEYKKNITGEKFSFHYKWDETASTGFSIFGEMFKNAGGDLATLHQAPTANNLATAKIYIIVDPDNQKETEDPVFINDAYADVISNWVKAGGVLLLMANDKANTELENFNKLANKFNFHFNNDLISHVINDQHFEGGAINISKNKVFKTAKKVFLKDACSITVEKRAQIILSQDDKAIVAGKKYGKGYILAVGDPWLYNEYVNGRLPKDFENDKAAKDVAIWLLKKASKSKIN